MGGFFRKMQLKTLTSFGLQWAAKGVKLCKSEEVKDKLTPLLNPFGLSKKVN